MSFLRVFLISAFLGFSASPGLAEESEPIVLRGPMHEVRMTETRPEIFVGDTLLLRVEDLTPQDQVRPNRDFIVDLKASAKAIEDSGFVLTELQDRKEFKTTEFWLAMVPVKSGKLTMPALQIVARDDQSALEPFQTMPVEFEVRTVLDSKDPNQKGVDYRTPVAIGMPWPVLLFLILLTLGIGFGIYAWWSRRHKKVVTVIEPEKPLLPEDEEAFVAFKALAEKNFITQGKFKPHYFGVSEILKRYLGRRYDIDAMEATTSELIRLLRDCPLVDSNTTATLKALFEKMDVVKFTDYTPLSQDANHLILEGQSLVERTKRVVVTEEKGKVS